MWLMPVVSLDKSMLLFRFRTMIKNLENRKDKAMIRSDTDDLWTRSIVFLADIITR
jgi:hypothetical protein